MLGDKLILRHAELQINALRTTSERFQLAVVDEREARLNAEDQTGLNAVSSKCGQPELPLSELRGRLLEAARAEVILASQCPLCGAIFLHRPSGLETFRRASQGCCLPA